MKGSAFSSTDVTKIAKLATIPITDSEAIDLAKGFTKVLTIVDELNNVNVSNVEPTSQVTGLENVFREDVVDKNRMFTQKEALSNANRTADGFFMVDQVLDE